MENQNYFVYIATNQMKNVLSTGVTDNIEQRLKEHYFNREQLQTFEGSYACYGMVYYECYSNLNKAVEREKTIKGWAKQKKEALVKIENPMFRFLNKTIMQWPPNEEWVNKVEERPGETYGATG